MSDRELLELAAKAAGIEYSGIYGDDDGGLFLDLGLWDEVIWWNPLDDDCDALRLAVKLGLTVAQLMASRVVEVTDYDETVMENEFHEADPDAATRRAITRAAAEIGRNMT